MVRTTEPLSLADGGTDYRELGGCGLRSLGIASSTIHVLVASNKRRAQGACVRSHACGLVEIPAGLLLLLAPGVYAAGPELTFVQMARRLTPVAAAVLAVELCGGYSHFSRMASGFYDRPPLTSCASIRSACAALKGLYGLGRAAEPLALALDGSRSPMETVLACDLAFPQTMGGQGFVKPVLNLEVPLDELARRKTHTATCRIDLAWPVERIGVEYDSSECHQDPVKDRARREALAHMGWTIYTADLAHMHDLSELVRTAGLFEGVVPRVDGGGPPPWSLSAELHRRLLKATRCGVGIEAALFPVPVRRGLVRCHVSFPTSREDPDWGA